MFAENKLFWMTFREGLLLIVNAVEIGLKSAGLLSGPTTSEIRAWWKEQNKQNIIVSMPKENATVE